jgi:hypothetical protein
MVLAIVNERLDELESRRPRGRSDHRFETAKTRPPALVLAGDRHREAVRARNREALQRFEQQQRQCQRR